MLLQLSKNTDTPMLDHQKTHHFRKIQYTPKHNLNESELHKDSRTAFPTAIDSNLTYTCS